ncbi:helix-turn-helix protein [Murinocardiopsis flavida]|uniref:Helix-turn-helix protein n=1 Tax=Murinocardiopsis flavida TaxID=645275 RepID=A0A2P8CWU4_9ACTN|nr:Scr1 family TA system antitoxin-like transcriptional regulator [Murinocardiopsis flavida]PSK89406.1 helix-turn-helix protein [Murinocardiopsis flavida]
MVEQHRMHAGAGTVPPGEGPADPWVRFGSRVRSAREKRGLGLSEIAKRAVVGDYTLRQIEDGEEDPGRRVTEILDTEYGAEGVLLDAWAQVHISDQLRAGATITDLHCEAAQIRAYAPLVLPDAYLTADYARALTRAERPMESNYLCGDRPRVPRLMATSSGPAFHCLIVDEAALHRTAATPDVQAAQHAHLHALAKASYITVHVIPAGTPHHPGLRGAFWTLAFSPRHTLAYTPHPRGPGHLVTDATHIKGYADLFATLQGVALSAADSLALLADTAAAAAAAADPAQAPPRRALTTGTTTAPTGSGAQLRNLATRPAHP